MSRSEKTIVVSIYILMFFGGLWHLLGLFQPLMRILAGPMLLITACVHAGFIAIKNKWNGYFTRWCVIVIVLGWTVEKIGIQYHIPFGHYTYGSVLQPQLFNVPVAIGFSWLQLILSAITFGQFVKIKLKQTNRVLYFTVIMAAMILFDFLMEQAAPRLDYWHWQCCFIPLRNFLSWGMLGAFFSWLYMKWVHQRIQPIPVMGIHIYIAQILYFVIVLIAYTA